MRLPAVATVLLLAVLAAGCGSGSKASGSGGGEQRVVAAFYPLAYAAERVGGSSVRVDNLTPAGAEPHDLELTPGDVRDVDRATVVLLLGDGFMPALEAAVQQTGSRAVDVLPAARRGAPPTLEHDPHVWLDPIRYATIVRAVGGALGDPVAASRLVARLRRLDAEYRRGLAQCRRNEIVTSHAAFGWLARRYGLTQVPLEGLQPEAEPSAREIVRLVDAVRRTGATTVFTEPLVSPKLADAVAREAGARTATLDPLEGLSADAVAAGEDYFSVMRANLATLEQALGCSR